MRSIEGAQICSKTGKLSPKVIEGKEFVAVKQEYTYNLAAPGKKTGLVVTRLSGSFPPTA